MDSQRNALLKFILLSVFAAAAIRTPAVAQTTAQAPAGAKTTTVVATSNSEDNYLGDRFVWPTVTPASTAAGGEPTICLPPGTRVVGYKSSLDPAVSVTTEANGDKKTAQTDASLPVYLDTGFSLADLFFGSNVKTAADGTKYVPSSHLCDSVDSAKLANIEEGQIVHISATPIAEAERSGWDYGVLVAPFKLQLSKGKELSGSASIGPYLGYRIPMGLDVTLNPVAFAGASNISINNTDASGKSTSESLAGLSYGAGLVFGFKSSFQVGLLIGADHVNSSAKYQYNNKPWLSFEIGYSFMQ